MLYIKKTIFFVVYSTQPSVSSKISQKQKKKCELKINSANFFFFPQVY